VSNSGVTRVHTKIVIQRRVIGTIVYGISFNEETNFHDILL